jgi:hypothetical protein
MEHTLGIPADNSMKFPNLYAYDYARIEYWGGGWSVPHFECDYTSRTCYRGIIWKGRGRFAGVILDDRDRTTVLKHIACWQNFRDCNDYDNGIWSFNTHRAERMTFPDIPASCVEAMHQRGEECPALRNARG